MMIWTEAEKLLGDGKKIRSKDWSEGFYVVKVGLGYVQFLNDVIVRSVFYESENSEDDSYEQYLGGPAYSHYREIEGYIMNGGKARFAKWPRGEYLQYNENQFQRFINGHLESLGSWFQPNGWEFGYGWMMVEEKPEEKFDEKLDAILKAVTSIEKRLKRLGCD